MNNIGLIVRNANSDDAATVAALFRHVRTSSLSFLPNLHSAAEDLAFFRDTVFRLSTVMVAETDRIVAFVAWRTGWVDHLYVHMDHTRRGIGTLLLDRAIDGQNRVDLWAFQRNTAALAFYRKHGFRVLYETDGSNNEEKEPDVRLGWERDHAQASSRRDRNRPPSP